MYQRAVIVDKCQVGGPTDLTLDGMEIRNVVSYSVSREVGGLPRITFTVLAKEVSVECGAAK